MHILTLSDLETQGGAAIAASRLMEALVEVGHRVTRLVNQPDRTLHDWSTLHLVADQPDVGHRIAKRFLPYRVQVRWDYRIAHRQLARALDRELTALRPDVINIHNMHGACQSGWSPDLISVCLHHAPTVWTLHDMWSFTGRCAYSYDCRKFLAGCDSTCPTPTEYPVLEKSRIADAWETRRNLFAAHPELTAVAPSRWLAREAQEGLWANHRVEVIPNGVQLDVYRPLVREMAREALGIETRSPVMLVAAQVLGDRRKGTSLLIKALQQVSQTPLTLLTLGSGPINVDAAGIQLHPLGYVDHERTKVLAYSAADIFVHPAPVDNFPNVVMEAIACGTPVVGFSTGGVPDMVRPGVTGWLSDRISPEALSKVIDVAIRELNAKDWRASCRAVAEAEYRVEQQAQRYVELFASLSARKVQYGTGAQPSTSGDESLCY